MAHFVSYDNMEAIKLKQDNYNKKTFVMKNGNKELSTNDFTDELKQKLKDIEANAQENDIEVIKVDGVQQEIKGKAVNIDLSAFAKKDDISKMYRYMGSVDNYGDLPSGEGVQKGDSYNVINADEEHGVAAGDNVVWNGEDWDNHRGNIDLSNFVIKESGKGLSTNDFTDELKAKLEGVGEEGDYVLPIASENTLGGIKVGDTLEINSDGVLTVKEEALGTNVTTDVTGTGNVITGVTQDDNGNITFTKGINAITEHQDISGKQDKTTAVTHAQGTSEGSEIKGVYIRADGSVAEMAHSVEADVPENAKFTDTDTHYTSKNVITTTTESIANTEAPIVNGYVHLNSVENGMVTSSHKIIGTGSVEVKTDENGNIEIAGTTIQECTEEEIMALFAEMPEEG